MTSLLRATRMPWRERVWRHRKKCPTACAQLLVGKALQLSPTERHLVTLRCRLLWCDHRCRESATRYHNDLQPVFKGFGYHFCGDVPFLLQWSGPFWTSFSGLSARLYIRSGLED